MTIERVSGQRPYVASWQAYGGHMMYVGVFPSHVCGQVLLATAESSEAAGFVSGEACAAALMAFGFKVCGMQIKFHPNGNDLLGWLGSSLPDLYLKSHPNASQRPSNGRKTPEPCE